MFLLWKRRVPVSYTHLVTGKVRLELYKGNLINAGVWSPFSLYREDIATFAAGGDYKQSDATGFISIYGLPTKVQAIVNLSLIHI